MEKLCPECGDTIKGRMDKKFCSDACRNAHNNKLTADVTNYVRNVNNILKRNRRILETLTPQQTAKTTKTKMLQMGFNFDYYTNSFKTGKGTSYIFCYDFGYVKEDSEYVFLVRKKDFSE
jgi:hypothetical protein